MIPLLHDFRGATVLVFGGGRVGLRKARRFAAEARVVVVSPSFHDEAVPGVHLVRAAPEPDDVAAWIARMSPALVVAATDDEAVNDAVETAARDAGVLVNRADRSGGRDPGSVVVPATVRDDPVVAAVATDGRSPALSAHLRERVADVVAGAGAVAEVTADVRADLRSRGVPADRRREVMRRLARSSDVWDAAARSPDAGRDAVEQFVEDALADRDR
jgi:precorrin-2 dehydrogenase/sirohydrochlorin ferrochelatase